MKQLGILEDRNHDEDQKYQNNYKQSLHLFGFIWVVYIHDFIVSCKVYIAAAGITGRSDVQCLRRWQKVLNPEIIKGYWTKEVLITFSVQCF